MGAISGHDGKRYTFVTMDWRSGQKPRQGLEVDFEVDGNNARQIFLISATGTSPAAAQYSGEPGTARLDFGSLYFSASGRIARKHLWLRFVLPYVVISQILSYIDQTQGFFLGYYFIGDTVVGIGTLSSLFSLIALWPSIAVNAKRLHDRNKSGWWLLVGFTGIGLIWLFIELGFVRGTVGDNRFGPDPTGA